uniref:Uncharacterized protein n=1 Tax=Tetranychus urticae TaxID=32264 RepID=T1KLA1_TETUR
MRSNSLGNSMEGVGGGGLPPPPPSHISESMGQTSAPLRHGMGPLNALGESHSYNYQDRNFIQGKRFMGFDSNKIFSRHANNLPL